MMKNYTVYFEIYGKKMKTKVLAETKKDAENQIKSKIKFHKVVKDKNDDFNKATDMMDSIISKLGKNPK